jgi:hypothetical protein
MQKWYGLTHRYHGHVPQTLSVSIVPLAMLEVALEDMERIVRTLVISAEGFEAVPDYRVTLRSRSKTAVIVR